MALSNGFTFFLINKHGDRKPVSTQNIFSMRKAFLLVALTTLLGSMNLAAHTLNNPVGADGRYIVKYDCTKGEFAAANDMEVDETFTFAVDITGTWLEEFVKGTPTAEGATRGIAINKWTSKGDVNGNTNRLKQISGNIYGMTVNYAQIFTDKDKLAAEVTQKDSTLCVYGQIFGFEFTAEEAGAGWWMWEGQEMATTQAPCADCLFAFAKYTGTKTSDEFYGDDFEEPMFGFKEQGYAAPCVKTGEAEDSRGRCGRNLYWALDAATSTLTITGYGDMDLANYATWRDLYNIDFSHVVLPEGLTSISSEAFHGYALTEVVVPSSVTYFGWKAFDCDLLTRFEYLGSDAKVESNGPIVNSNTRLTYVRMSADMYRNSREFWGTGADTVIISGGVIDMERLLESNPVHIDLSVTPIDQLGYAEDDTYFPMGGYRLRSIVLPENLQTIGVAALNNCKYLTSIAIPASVKRIGTSAFENCRSLQSVVFRGTDIESIGDWAFYHCHDLQTITIPEGVTTIGKSAFYGCSYLKELVLPSTMRSIEDNGFALCGKLQQIRVRAQVPPTIEAKTFEDVDRSTMLIVPAGTRQAYSEAPYWKEFYNVKEDIYSSVNNNSTDDDTTIRKVIRDGQVLILRGGHTYTVTGIKVE